MSFLFTRNKPKTPQEVVYALNELVTRQDAAADQKILEEIYKLISQAKLFACGENDSPPDPDDMSALSKEIYATDLLVHVVASFDVLDFGHRRDIALIFAFLLRRQIGAHSPTIEYLLSRPALFEHLISAAGSVESHISACNMLKECAKHEQLTQFILNLPSFWDLFEILKSDNFETSSDCFVMFGELLKSHLDVTARFFRANGPRFTQNMNVLLSGQSYVVRRQAIRIQSQLLRYRKLKEYMKEYVGEVTNLIVVMKLMRDKSKNIHYETFQLFKLFIANPDKSPRVYDILARNKHPLLDYLKKLKEADRKDDESFGHEYKYVRDEILKLKEPLTSGSDAQGARLPRTPSPVRSSPTRSGMETGLPSAPPSPSRAQVPSEYRHSRMPPSLGDDVPELIPPHPQS